ncbi:Outer membrane assembly lipoprotein precursor BamD [Flavobacterium indicum GPTSA100-9 = DSM 17447]|uniref:Outer membrane assembly lipoprotein BamD n=1 Tax=Flavobacterium indicum (strain DSM 17447 / CIP 109464 / GPTSA100-9) TaxID=1094466 RepID=H8XUN6_FLAIG|nr:outer membrane protein assembly factor BamD [Flavobacterium indicum]CCG53814.1 Outer membrane assembly lipoprotein precursor BamD [Flavobacterium indicum GPTSA100-9 = DSM 17447]
MTKYIYIFFSLLVLASCSEYQRALKSDQVDFKNEVFSKLYEKEKYAKAIRLFEQYATSVRGKSNAEDVFYKYAKALYITKQYYTAGYQFESFAANYPKSVHAQEAAFLGADCYAKLSPIYSLDQVDTYKALEKLQAFADKYPNSEYLPKANAIVKELNEKLELKAFEIAKQYYTTGEYFHNYNTAIKAFDNFILDYPGTKFREDALFYKFGSAYQMAILSVPAKKQERLNEAKNLYNSLIKYKADTKFLDQANKMLETVDRELKQYTN